jgi:hypothetical protein
MSGFKLLDDSSSRDAPEGARRAGTSAADQPLGLTIHSMPSPEQTMGAVVRKPGVGRWKMIAVLLVCAAPVVASYFTYYVIKPEGRRNFGELINPQQPLPDLPGASLDGATVNLKSLKGQWLLVSVAGGACDEVCRRHLYLQRQIRESLGKEKDRLDWVWLIPDAAPVPEQLRPALRGATTLRVAPEGLSAWLTPASGHQLPDHLYLVDPMGNWMLRFPANLDMDSAAKAKRDVERVLRAANSWDKAGRETAD